LGVLGMNVVEQANFSYIIPEWKDYEETLLKFSHFHVE